MSSLLSTCWLFRKPSLLCNLVWFLQTLFIFHRQHPHVESKRMHLSLRTCINGFTPKCTWMCDAIAACTHIMHSLSVRSVHVLSVWNISTPWATHFKLTHTHSCTMIRDTRGSASLHVMHINKYKAFVRGVRSKQNTHTISKVLWWETCRQTQRCRWCVLVLQFAH